MTLIDSAATAMARTKAGSGRLQPYTFTPAATNGPLQPPPPVLVAPSATAIPDEPIQSIPYIDIEQDPEVLEAAQILMSIYKSGAHAASSVPKDARLGDQDSLFHAHDDRVSNVKVAAPGHSEDDLEMLDSPTRQFQARTAKRRTTRGRAVMITKKPPSTRTRSARYQAIGVSGRDKDRAYFEHPVLTAIHGSPAKKARRGKRASCVKMKESNGGDTTEMDQSASASSDGGEGDLSKRRRRDREDFENAVLTKTCKSPAKKSRRAQTVSWVKSSTQGDTTEEIDLVTPTDSDNLDDSDYTDQSPTPHRKPSARATAPPQAQAQPH